MTSNGIPSVLFALDANVGGSGWALFSSREIVATGVIGADVKRGASAKA